MTTIGIDCNATATRSTLTDLLHTLEALDMNADDKAMVLEHVGRLVCRVPADAEQIGQHYGIGFVFSDQRSMATVLGTTSDVLFYHKGVKFVQHNAPRL